MEAEIFFGGYGQVGPAEASEGDLGELDTVDLEVLVPCGGDFSTWRAAAATAGYARGGGMPGWTGIYVRRTEARQEGADAIVRVSGHGLLVGGAEKRKRVITAAGTVISIGPVAQVVLAWTDEEQVEDPDGDETRARRRVPKVDDDTGEEINKVFITPTGTQERWNVREAIVQVVDTYFATSLPATNVIGTAQTPTDAPTPPPYKWSGYLEALRYNDPAGWVLDNREPEVIVAGALWRVTDTYGYYYTAQPD